ncbi:hypothetical protein [Paenibacillus tarimensis]|uniref:hypothetical protein n=1 Tax=Paenibacillus tarimensis TaxID=416012 RepID=UPI001F192F15|nr:hypothetical protein [Paenibacillus tarimensis]MCF2943323.1 hypothetical protein [Paenibacillus tarimensis]
MISKKWLLGVIGFAAYLVKKYFGLEMPAELVDDLAELVLLLSAIIPMVANMFKHSSKPAGQKADTA